jgi:hypothetical protein
MSRARAHNRAVLSHDRTVRWLSRLAALAHLRNRCRASGWRVHRGCTDGRGAAVCPSCERSVGTRGRPVSGLPVRRIKVHAA